MDTNSDQTIGPYRLLELLGQGGMGEVYLAETPEGDRVAIKTLLQSVLEDEKHRKRFLRELQLIDRLERHEHIVEVNEVLLRPEVSRDAVVMEWLDGPSLREVLKSGPLEVGYALRLARQMALALAHVHAQGLVHRDFKPPNVVLTDEGRRAVLLDFGIAKQVRRVEDATRITETGQVLGTAEYMAPEQVQGGEVSAATDMFAFGVVLYQMLTGISPFRGSTPAETSVNTLYHHPVPADRQRELIPSAVSDLADRLMAKIPADRPESMERVIEELDVLIHRPSTRMDHRPMRRWTRWIAGAAAGLVLLAGVAVWAWKDRDEPTQPSSTQPSSTQPSSTQPSSIPLSSADLPSALAVLPFAGERGPGAMLALALAAQLQEVGFRVVDPETVAGALKDLELEIHSLDPERDLHRLLTYLDAGSAVGGTVSSGGAGRLLHAESWRLEDGDWTSLGRDSGARPVEISTRLATRLFEAADIPKLGPAAIDRARSSWPYQVEARIPFATGVLALGTNDPWTARRELEEAHRLDPDSAVVGIRLAQALRSLRLDGQARTLIQATRDQESGSSWSDDRFAAVAADIEGRHRRAVKLWQSVFDRSAQDPEAGWRRLEVVAQSEGPSAALAVLDQLDGVGNDRGGLATLRARARLEILQGNYVAALESADLFLGDAQSVGARRSEALALLYRGIALQGQGRAEEATQTVEAARALLMSVDDPLLEAQALQWTGILLTERGQPSPAILLHQRAHEIYAELRAGSEDGPSVLGAVAQTSEALALLQLGRNSEAEPLLEGARKVLEEAGTLREAGRVYLNLGVIHHLTERLASAAELYSTGLDLASRAGDTETKAVALTNLGEIELALGRPDAALDLFHQSLTLHHEEMQAADQIYVQLLIGEAHLQNRGAERAKAAFLEVRRLASSASPIDEGSLEQAEQGLARVAELESGS